ncbi:hypothetical protein GN156_14860 [bacterium LRH843]|nr:hypothetical protein [bacterium LRH843]
MKKAILIWTLLIMLFVGCSPTYEENIGYKKSTINENFPIPDKVELVNADFDNPNIKKGVKYLLNNIGGTQGLYPPKRYFQEIEKWGWEELTDKQMGHVHFFKQGEAVISVVVKEDHFEVYEMKDDSNF